MVKITINYPEPETGNQQELFDRINLILRNELANTGVALESTGYFEHKPEYTVG